MSRLLEMVHIDAESKRTHAFIGVLRGTFLLSASFMPIK